MKTLRFIRGVTLYILGVVILTLALLMLAGAL